MANKERFLTLQKLRTAKKTVTEMKLMPKLTSTQTKLLDKLYVELDGLEDILFIEAIDDKINDLRAGGAKLKKIADDLSKETDKLKKVAKVTDIAATSIKILADIVSKGSELLSL